MRRLPLHAVYPDGPAPYFTIQALGEPGKLGAQWLAIKSAALDAVLENGGTITHHHAVGRDHRDDGQRPPLFAEALRAAKKTLDPQDCSIRAFSLTRDVCVGGMADSLDEAKAAFRAAWEAHG